MSLDIQKNELHYYIDLLRIDDATRTPEQSETSVTALYNIIRTMRLSRRDKICVEDFSRLDFGNISFNGVHFSLNGEFPSCFDGCKLNEWNFIGGHSGAVTSVAWSPDGKHILTGSSDGTAILWDADSGLMRNKILRDEKNDYFEKFNNDSIKRSGLENEESLPFIKEDRELIDTVVYSNDGKYCLTGSLDGTVRIWDLETSKCKHTLSGHSKAICSAAFSPEGRYCLTGSWDRTAKIWNCMTGKCRKTLSGQSLISNSVVRSHDEKYCITSSIDGSLKMWDLQAQKCIWVLENYVLSIDEMFPEDFVQLIDNRVFKPGVIRAILELKQFSDPFCSASFSLDGKYCLIGLANGSVHLLSVETGERLRTIKRNSSFASLLAFLPDAKHFLIITSGNTLEKWNIEKEKCLKKIKLHKKSGTSVAVSPDGKLCLIGAKKGKVKICDMKKRKCIRSIKVQKKAVYSLAFSPNGRYLMTSSKRGTAKMWDYKKKKCMKTIRLSDTNGIVKWDFPYVTVRENAICTIYKYDCFDPNGRDEPELIGSFYNVDGMHIKNCPFRNITADETTRKILYQYGGDIDNPEQ